MKNRAETKRHTATQVPRKALRGGIQKSILTDFSGNVGDSRQSLSKTSQWLQERASDTPTKGLLWWMCGEGRSSSRSRRGAGPPSKWLQERHNGSKNETGMPSLEKAPLLEPFLDDLTRAKSEKELKKHLETRVL